MKHILHNKHAIFIIYNPPRIKHCFPLTFQIQQIDSNLIGHKKMMEVEPVHNSFLFSSSVDVPLLPTPKEQLEDLDNAMIRIKKWIKTTRKSHLPNTREKLYKALQPFLIVKRSVDPEKLILYLASQQILMALQDGSISYNFDHPIFQTSSFFQLKNGHTEDINFTTWVCIRVMKWISTRNVPRTKEGLFKCLQQLCEVKLHMSLT
jgi:hypothetical protein